MQLINNVKNAQKNNSLNWQHRFHLNLDVVGRSGNKSMNSDFRVNTNLLKGYLSSKTQLLEYFAFVYLSYRSHATVKPKPHDSCHGSFLSYLFITFFACFTCKSLQIKKYIYPPNALILAPCTNAHTIRRNVSVLWCNYGSVADYHATVPAF